MSAKDKLSNHLKPFTATLLLLVAVSSLVTSCSSGDQSGEAVLRMNLGNEPPSLDWHVTTDSTSFDVIANIMTGLTQYGRDLKIEPACATSWEILDEGGRYVFHLRDDAYWTDGVPVTAHDFEYAWKRLVTPETGGAYANFLYCVENAHDINTGKNPDPQSLGVRAIDDRTLEVRLTRPAAYFLYLTAACPFYPARKDVIEKHGDRWTEPGNIVTNGPFRLARWQHEYKIELVSNKRFFEGESAIDRVKMFMVPEQSTAFALYENDELDYVDNRSFSTSDVERYLDSPQYRFLSLLRCSYVAFNVTKKPFTDRRVRKAFSMAVDRSIFPKILRRREQPLYSWIPPTLLGYSPDSGVQFDPERARVLLAQAGYPAGRGFPKVELLYPNREDARLVVEAIQAQLKKHLGVSISLVNQEWKVYLARRKKDPPPMFRAAWGADFPDPESFMNIFTSDSGNNHTRWKSQRYDRLVRTAAGTLDRGEREKLYRAADRLLCKEDVVIMPAYLGTQNVLVKPWVSGITFNALDVQTFKNAVISKSP